MIDWLNWLLVQYFQEADLHRLADNCYEQNRKLLDYVLMKVDYVNLSPDQITRNDEIKLKFITALSDSNQEPLAEYLRRENSGGMKKKIVLTLSLLIRFWSWLYTAFYFLTYFKIN